MMDCFGHYQSTINIIAHLYVGHLGVGGNSATCSATCNLGCYLASLLALSAELSSLKLC